MTASVPPPATASPYDGIDPGPRTTAWIVAALCLFNLLVEEITFMLARDGTIGLGGVAVARPIPYVALGVVLFVIGRVRARRIAASVGTIGLGLALGLYSYALPHLYASQGGGFLNAMSWVIAALVPALIVLYWGIARRDGVSWLRGVAWAVGLGFVARMMFGSLPPAMFVGNPVLTIFVENVLYTAPAVIGGVIAWRHDQPGEWA